MVAMGLMALLFMSQTYNFMQFNKVSEVVIDASTSNVNKVLKKHGNYALYSLTLT
jgi:hypothetical protein